MPLKKKKICLWSFGLAKNNMYVFYRIKSAELITVNTESKEKIKEMTNMMWKLKV